MIVLLDLVMTPLLILLAVFCLTYGKILQVPDNHNAYGYLERSIAIGEKIRMREDAILKQQRIVGGVPASLGQYPYQAGLLIDIIGFEGRGICGGSLLNEQRIITAAHCWHDGIHQGWRVTVALGTDYMFNGGTRLQSSVVVSHPNWFPFLVRNDVAIVYLPTPVTFSSTIAPVSLPTGPELQEDYVGESAVASGYGLTEDGGSVTENQSLHHVNLRVISNRICRLGFPLVLQERNICTSGVGGVGTCQGDSRGPLVVTRNNRRILIGVTSFGIALGCQLNFPAAYARTTSFIDFINQHL